MGRVWVLSAVAGVFISGSLVGQDTAGTASTVQVERPAPNLATPSIALPGSGTASGAPAQFGVNDPRSNSQGQIVQPGVNNGIPIDKSAEGYVIATPEASVTSLPAAKPSETVVDRQSHPSAETGTSSSPTMRQGLGAFADQQSSAGISAGQTMSVADAAAQYKARKVASHSRRYMNADIYVLNGGSPGLDTNSDSTALPQSDQPATSPAGAGSTQGVIDPNDLAKVEAAVARSRAREKAQQNVQQAPKK